MNINLKTCIYRDEQSDLLNYFNKDKFQKMGFDVFFQQGECQDLFGYLSANKVDIFILDTTNIEKERCNVIIEIIYKNFCKSILIITDDKYYLYNGVKILQYAHNQNFDLMLNFMLFEMKRDIEEKPCRNEKVIKSKIRQMLTDNCFTNKNDGFEYYVEAIYMMYLNYPYRCRMMSIYADVGKMFNKTCFAIEKSMRLALLNATKRARLLPSTKENQAVKDLMTYDMNNKFISNIFVNKLALDKDLEAYENQTNIEIYE